MHRYKLRSANPGFKLDLSLIKRESNTQITFQVILSINFSEYGISFLIFFVRYGFFIYGCYSTS